MVKRYARVKQHRPSWPQVYEYLVDGTITKFRVMCRKAGYHGPQIKEFDRLKYAKEYASELEEKIKTLGVKEAGISYADRYAIELGKKMLAPFNVSFEECFKREVAYQLELRKRNTYNTIEELAKEWINERLST
jgi:hypothetical protein